MGGVVMVVVLGEGEMVGARSEHRQISVLARFHGVINARQSGSITMQSEWAALQRAYEVVCCILDRKGPVLQANTYEARQLQPVAPRLALWEAAQPCVAA